MVKIRLLVGRSGADGSHSPGDEISLPDEEAIRLVDMGSAEPVDESAFKKIAEKARKKIEERERIERENLIRLEKEAAQMELEVLYREVVELEGLIAGVSLSEKEISTMIEELKKREVKTNRRK